MAERGFNGSFGVIGYVIPDVILSTTYDVYVL